MSRIKPPLAGTAPSHRTLQVVLVALLVLAAFSYAARSYAHGGFSGSPASSQATAVLEPSHGLTLSLIAASPNEAGDGDDLLPGPDVYAGDNEGVAGDGTVQGCFGYDLSRLPANAVITSATLLLRENPSHRIGSPFSLGPLYLERTRSDASGTYATLNRLEVATDASRVQAGAGSVYRAEVKALVQQALREHDRHAAFRLRFGTLSNHNGRVDRAQFALLPLRLSYMVPRAGALDVGSGLSYTFVGGSPVDSTNWFDARNWSPQGVPGPNDSATINGRVNITGTGAVVVAQLNLVSGSLSGKSLGFNPAVTPNGLNWSGGTLGVQITTIQANGTLNISGDAPKVISSLNGQTIDNFGIATWTGAGDIAGAVNLNESHSLTNESGATFNAQSSGTISDIGFTFNNLSGATFNANDSSGAGTTTFDTGRDTNTSFNNKGIVNVLSGTLELGNGTRHRRGLQRSGRREPAV